MQDSYLLTTYRLEGLDLFKQFKLRKHMKVLINNCHGGFGFSREFELQNRTLIEDAIGRHDVALIEAVESFGLYEASDQFAKIAIDNVPDGCEYHINEYDGAEYVDDTWIDISMDELRNGLSEDRIELAMKCISIKINKSL